MSHPILEGLVDMYDGAKKTGKGIIDSFKKKKESKVEEPKVEEPKPETQKEPRVIAFGKALVTLANRKIDSIIESAK